MIVTTFNGRQIAAARALARLTIRDLAKAASVAPRTIVRFEAAKEICVTAYWHEGAVTRSVFDRIIQALVEHGVELVDEGKGHGAGVRWSETREQRGIEPASIRMSEMDRIFAEAHARSLKERRRPRAR